MITRLNIGGPSIQAVRLTTAMRDHGCETVLFHGRLGAGEGDMSYLIPPGTDTRYLPTLCRALSPFDDLRTLWRLYREFRALQPAIVHTHMAKAGMLGRLAAFAYNLTRGTAPRAKIVHTYHGHVLDGYFSKFATTVFIAIERELALVSDRIIAISPAIRQELLNTYRIGRDSQYRVVPLGFDLKPFAAVDDAARAAARRDLSLPADVPVAGKTGTTDDNTDVWFVGMTPDIVAGVWLGFDRPQPIAERGVAGGSMAAPVFARMLDRAGYARPSEEWNAPPAGITPSPMAIWWARSSGA